MNSPDALGPDARLVFGTRRHAVRYDPPTEDPDSVGAVQANEKSRFATSALLATTGCSQGLCLWALHPGRRRRRASDRYRSLRQVASLAFLEKYCLFLCVLLVAIGCVRVVSTYHAMSLTVDEPFHLACAIEYWSMHSTTLDMENPPIARAIEASGAYLAGARLTGLSNPWAEGAAILARANNFEHLLFLYRLGTLPFSSWRVW